MFYEKFLNRYTFILDFIQSDSDERGKARTLEIGYIFNGEVIDEKVISETENKIILDIPKSGQYGSVIQITLWH